MATIKRMSDISLKDAFEAWNKGFEDYYVPMQMTIEQFTHRLGQDGLSPDHSFVAYVDGRPAGILLNGMKTFHDRKWAWNGGTSVAVPYRQQGVARKLIESTLELYTKENVDTASLEAISINKKAIRLYESFNYKIVDRLLFLKNREPDFSYNENIHGWTIEKGSASDVQGIPFYHYRVPWKSSRRG